ncbi:PucR family transcriptional regulator [Bacillus sp. UNC438CL73TsuS30]|uniref:PucR family transcriptional regulator n=1 Tax=Bacillus sp. UNC438CL73TsuS30 TaxID=1340434 RepID=UPI000AF37C2E|nr:PucR family transcriptional regulator [Bacillus sp. UNC438CL73TsuS30]
MSVKVRDLLDDKFFVGYKNLAGAGGLDREIQSVSVFDAPDGYRWFSGKEFALSTGYLFKDNIELFKDVIYHLNDHNSAALGLKVNRYLKQIPQEILTLCNNLNFPLIDIPDEPAWVEIMDAVNAIAMHGFMMRMNNGKRHPGSTLESLYPEIKINECIENLSKEIGLPISIVDYLEDRNFHYPSEGKTKELEKILRGLAEPNFDYQREKIYDKINIYRIKDLDGQNKSWIVLPIKVHDILVGNLVVWEMEKELGYFDFSALRITFELLLYIFTQMYYMNSKEANFQDDFIQEILLEKSDQEKLFKKAKHLGWDVRKNYVCIRFQQLNDGINLDDYRGVINSSIRRFFPKRESPLGLLEGSIIIFHPVEEELSQSNMEELKKKCSKLIAALEEEIPKAKIKGGIGCTTAPFYHIKKSYRESVKTVEIGQFIYPNKNVLSYKDLGPFGFIHLRSFKEDFSHVIENLLPVLQQDDREELISTLKAFLESKCNFNLAAKKLYIHNNTVRYRIAKIQQLTKIDLDDPPERLKLEMVLMFEKHLNF